MAATATSTGAGNWSANATWAITGIGTASGADGALASGILTPTVSPTWTVDALIGRYIQLDAGTWYLVTDNTATTATLASPPADDPAMAYLLGGPPLADDAVVIATGHTITFDVARAPATAGTFLSLTGVGTGAITIAPATLGYDVTIAATTFQSGAAILVLTTTAAHSNRTVTTIGNAIAGTVGACFSNAMSATTSTWAHTGGLKGGSGSTTYGFSHASTGKVTVTNGNIEAGSGISSRGFNSSSTGVVEFTNVNLIDSTASIAYAGKPPVWTITNKANYHQMPTVNADTRGSQVMRFYLPPQEHEVLETVAGGFEDGVDPPGYAAAGTLPLDNVLVASTGHYVAPVQAEVLRAADGGTGYGAGGGTAGTLINCPAANAQYTGTAYYGKAGALVDGLLTLPNSSVVTVTDGGADNPNVAGTYVRTADWDGYPCWTNGTYFIWWGGGGIYVINDVKGDPSNSYSRSLPLGTYGDNGTYSGAPVATGLTADPDLVLTTGYYGVIGALVQGHDAGDAAGQITGAAAQLVTDAAAVNAELDNMTTAVTNLLDAANDGTYVVPVQADVLRPADGGTAYGPGGGTDGTLNLGTYTLKSGVVAAQYVLTGYDNYTGGSPGTLTLPADGTKILNTETPFGVVGSEITGVVDLSAYTLISGVVAAANVLYGNDNYTGGDAGTLTLPHLTGDGTYTPDPLLVDPTASYGVIGSLQAGTGPTDAQVATAVWAYANRTLTA